mmetsp:Transcript_7399/g.13741  ORF Transcript_7399/g.13741 Transcript_7399/m.13741 type:complete len:203 (+) Transcript_7399:102-710(+)|eukprot:CAMPEP_0201610598 /NCGR_PEP_ID=MMETSP0492-20130828/17265_1 /ASSEMBLY_ACC=CAM_ASM_000837 /TAXON_ID=420259 /ORGANISM="Thalassiosira gravida, Strain GMp14c1" /LENGTH=202 /DNA_ID=CAMNT_0048076465 /DNA_START=77 /DNA_END=685 /DNA_ORIENTATION=-
MKNLLSSLLAISASLSPHTSEAFAPSNVECSSRTRSTTHLSATADSSRRNFLSTVATAAASASALVLSPLPSVADVSDGNVLPQGAAQFSRVIKVRAQLSSVAKRVTENADEIDKKEWDQIDNFLRTVYGAGEDMKVIAKGIFDPEKKTQAEKDIKLLQSLVQAAQKPVANKDAKGFGVVASKADSLFEEFFDLLSDVPDEL